MLCPVVQVDRYQFQGAMGMLRRGRPHCQKRSELVFLGATRGSQVKLLFIPPKMEKGFTGLSDCCSDPFA